MGSSAPELSPRAREIVAAARELLDEEGREALTMRRLAERLGIRAPSIYKHLPGKDALEAAVISDGFQEQAAAFEAAGGSLEALARAYRAFALEHPHLYRLMTEDRSPGSGSRPAPRSAPRRRSSRRRAVTATPPARSGRSPTA
jgi:AcrR family transcriptional regulator